MILRAIGLAILCCSDRHARRSWRHTSQLGHPNVAQGVRCEPACTYACTKLRTPTAPHRHTGMHAHYPGGAHTAMSPHCPRRGAPAGGRQMGGGPSHTDRPSPPHRPCAQPPGRHLFPAIRCLTPTPGMTRHTFMAQHTCLSRQIYW